jgi:hypothetical protein
MQTELGYFFHPSENPDLPGHPRLDVTLYPTPMREHYDPKKAIFEVADPETGIEHANITHPWVGPEHLQATAGYIRLVDRSEKVVEAFTFGGSLDIASQKDHTSCSLVSPVPIFHVTDRQDLQALLVNEFEALLAIRRAAWTGHKVDFRHRLAKLAPVQLYAVGLEEVEARLLQSAVTLRGDQYWKMRHMMNELRRQFQETGNWPDPLPALADLL